MTSLQNDIPKYSIGTAAKMLNVSVQTLRLYEAEGLLLIHKTEGRQRLYSESDIDRIRCIRKAINEDKISIGGIKQIQGLIPCWDITHCSDAERSECPVFRNRSGGCWNQDHQHSVCASKECRLCEVYKLSSDCEQIKSLIFRSSLARLPENDQIPL